MLNWRNNIKKIVPGRLQFKLVSLKHTFTKFRQYHYSQNGEDIILSDIFPKEYCGLYVDVGAHHPYRISNTAMLHERGWCGINIDANPDTIKLFDLMRPRDINVLAGVCLNKREMTYHMFSDPAVNTFSTEEAQKWKNKTWIEYLGARKINTNTLKEILEEHLTVNKSIDLLNIDVEGFDLEVLKSNDWNKFKPKVVIVEAHDFELEDMKTHPIYQFLNKNGYKLESAVKFSLIFVR